MFLHSLTQIFKSARTKWHSFICVGDYCPQQLSVCLYVCMYLYIDTYNILFEFDKISPLMHKNYPANKFPFFLKSESVKK